jgi:hypothetical protein
MTSAAEDLVAASRRKSSDEGARRQAGCRSDCGGRSLRARLPCGARSSSLPHNSLRSLRSLRSDRCGKFDVVARCARWLEALRSSAPQSRSAGLPARAFADPLVIIWSARLHAVARQAVPGGGEFAATRSAGRWSARAQRALPHLTRRICLSAVSAANVASYAARPGTEHRSGVGAQRRPSQPEPPSGTACRDARSRRQRAVQAQPC